MKASEIKPALEKARRTQTELAQYMGRSFHSISRMTRSSRELTVTEAAQVEAFLASSSPAPPGPTMLTVPVFGFAAAGGGDRVRFASNDVLEEIEVPAGFVRADMFGVRVAGDSMEPRLFSGENVLAAQHLPPARGGDCVVELTDGSALVKRYEGTRDGFIFLRQYNPDQEIRLPAASVRAIHAIIMRR